MNDKFNKIVNVTWLLKLIGFNPLQCSVLAILLVDKDLTVEDIIHIINKIDEQLSENDEAFKEVLKGYDS